jgi:hypothetical protein
MSTLATLANNRIRRTVRGIRIRKRTTKTIVTARKHRLRHCTIAGIPGLREERTVHALWNTEGVVQNIGNNEVADLRVASSRWVGEVICGLAEQAETQTPVEKYWIWPGRIPKEKYFEPM